MPKTRMAVLGVGAFGKNHVRVIRESERAELVAVLLRSGTRDLSALDLARHLLNTADFLPLRQRILKERRERWIQSY